MQRANDRTGRRLIMMLYPVGNFLRAPKCRSCEFPTLFKHTSVQTILFHVLGHVRSKCTRATYVTVSTWSTTGSGNDVTRDDVVAMRPATEEIPSAVFTDIDEIRMRTRLWYSAVNRYYAWRPTKYTSRLRIPLITMNNIMLSNIE